ncbi:MAG TPA: M20 family metallopeptidase [Clostridiaceae bacterium]|nr:M20 family metallopeptidase [Clostridiaceae bacterium]
MISNSLLKFAAKNGWYVYKDGEYTFGEFNGYPITAKTDEVLSSYFVPIAGIAPENLIELTTWLESKRFPLKLADYEMTDNFIAIRARDTALSGPASKIRNFLQILTDKLIELEVPCENCAICGLPASDKALYVGLYCAIHPDCIGKAGVDYTLSASPEWEEEELILLSEEDENKVASETIRELAEAFSDQREDFLSDLSRLIAVPSVDGEPTEDAPFGKATREALDLFLEIADRMGFATKNVGNVAGYAEMGEGDDMVAAVCHLDVVPAGSGWETDPFELTIQGDRVMGRGVMDDKGPLLSALYAMKTLKDDPDYRPSRRIRLIVGLNEEKGSACMDHYREVEEIPSAGFTADAVFPAIYAEKGNAVIDLWMERKEDDAILEAKAGEAVNMVPGLCQVTLRGQQSRDYEGTMAHASLPELGVNAISAAMEAVASELEASGKEDSFVHFYNALIGWELDGTKLGLAFEDETGRTTVNAGLLSIGPDRADLTLNMRYPVTMNLDEAKARLSVALLPYGVRSSWPGIMPPLIQPKDSHLISTLMGVYRELTGTEAEPLAIGGGTYARSLPNIVGFGPSFPGDEDVAHQANEWASVDTLLAGAALYREALKRLAE